MVLAFSGDEFLIGREARKVLRAQGYYVSNTNSLVEEITGSKVKDSIFQGSLFGGKAVFLDFDSGFVGQSDTKHRNEVMKVLQAVPDDVLVVIVDSKATVGRKKAFSKCRKLQQSGILVGITPNDSRRHTHTRKRCSLKFILQHRTRTLRLDYVMWNRAHHC